ncbi:glycosyltransferase family 2 protein [Nonomuraea sp. NEAU-A123]|uniref:glycosyltransferase family 2 protein n=1 Tax=Nonomuraea sp. NEAU-A123 TaxID=2839649 RepID=UPI001BE4CAEB|nr:glycosyltransferase family 2 protein [Nonomuraea sp. NEAU-A123]MBT2233719.1 glycosyltransferase family 2 protein [Nonomuraea sp. NEAU-A123]
MKVDVVLPCLNEEAALPWVLGRMPDGFHPIVVDNGSTDGSARVAAKLGATVVTEPRRGFGAACHAGLVAATTDVVCFMDADASLDPEQLPLVAGPVLAGEAELVLGRRLLGPGDRRCGYPLEMVLRAASAGWRIGEVEVNYLARAGRSKVTGTVRGTLRAIGDMRRVLAGREGRA